MKNLIYLSLFLTSTILINPTFSFAKDAILVLGDSLTEGHNLAKESSYPSILENMLLKDGFSNYRIINGGISGSTTASGKSRLRWFFKASPTIMILALGANDGLRGFKIEQTTENLEKIIEMGKAKNIKIILCGMKVPTNYGKEYGKKFEGMFLKLKDKYKLTYIPFLLKDVGGVKELNLEDGIHPNAEGYKVVAKTVYEYLKPLLEKEKKSKI